MGGNRSSLTQLQRWRERPRQDLAGLVVSRQPFHERGVIAGGLMFIE